jgi:exonuclease SbcC
MKPLQLSIEGLHSFKERQVIDFVQLSDTGLFGIFGKTGSGKSTVLDAMTLALYGVVFRAASRTQGVLNSQLDKLEVSFTFAIGAEPERKIFRVERGFKRHKEKRDSVQAMVCRLVEVRPEQNVVIAENANEVTRKIEEIIGLNMEDFTRSVVLPQGEFAKFLQLKDAERIRMLERIFALADYGSKLTEKVKQAREQVTRQLELVERAIQEQGEVSQAQLIELKAELGQKGIDLAKLSQETVDFEREFNEQRILWQLQIELEQVLAKQRLHYQTRNEIALKRAILERAELAQQVSPYLENAQKAVAQLAFSREELQTVTAVYQNEVLINQQIKAEFTKVETIYLQKQPELIAKRTQVEGLLTLEVEKQAKEKQQHQATQELARLTAVLEDFQAKLTGALGDKAAKEAERQNLDTRIKELTVDTTYKEQLWLGVDLEKDLEHSRVECEKLKLALDEQGQQQSVAQQELYQNTVLLVKLTEQWEQLQAQLQDHQAQKPGNLESYAKRTQELTRLENVVDQITACHTELATTQAELAKIRESMNPLHMAQERINISVAQEQQNLQQLEELQIRLTTEVRALEEKNLAANLARALRAGKPCPVCGSSHHPRLAEPKGEMLEAKKLKLAETEAALRFSREQLEQFNRELFQGLIQTEQGQNRFEETQAKLDAIEAKLTELKEGFIPDVREQTPAELKNYLQELQTELDGYRGSIGVWEERQQTLQQELNSLKEAHSAANNQVQLLTTQSAVAAKSRRKLTEQLHMVEAAVAEKLQQLQNLQQQLSVTEFQAEQARILNNERQVAEIRETIAKLSADLASLESVDANLRRERETVNLKVQELKTTIQNLAREIAERETKIAAVTEGKSPQELLNAINDYLAKLAQKYEYLKGRWETSQTSLQNFNNQLVEVRKQMELSQEAATQTKAVLGQVLQEKSFLHENDVQVALRSAPEQAELKAEITEFEDAGKRYQHQLESLNQKIAGRTITIAEWENAQKVREQLTIQREQLVADHAKMQAKLADMEIRFAKVRQYLKERQETATRKAMTDEIAKLLQGEAFVAYIAEEHMHYILSDASRRLERLTGGRYLLTLDENKDFCVVDNTNGGIARPVSSLSGGETFLVSFSLALALSGKIQLNGRHPLEFFFLDEGFGTLDSQLLEVVMDSLEKLRQENLTIGVISHMPELRNRISRRLIITAASPNGTGSQVRIEKA